MNFIINRKVLISMLFFGLSMMGYDLILKTAHDGIRIEFEI